uniref:Uncharacterized protein n=1 Tax=Vibrio splendidus TaxID=29497 RepID=A0A0H3ZQA2_VIBSP|nr:hypothetical protein [Vibrio splendidus]
MLSFYMTKRCIYNACRSVCQNSFESSDALLTWSHTKA